MASETHPKGKTVTSKAETPIVIAMDVTSSRGDDSKILYDKLPMFFWRVNYARICRRC